MIDPVVAEVIKRCKRSPSFFIDNFCKVKHPKLGIIPFKLFSYQKRCLRQFKKHRFTIFRKCRQCGISTLTGGYALWYAMFRNNQTILIVSKRDDDAKEYLGRNVKFAYNNLPQWMKDLWKPELMNEHTLGFANGSVIRSLTSSPDTLRSNASSLNIIDEAAFIDKMEDMWAGGYSTLQHGGDVIVVSTPKGVGNWYWKTWADAIDKSNDFNPIIIDWWDMDWKLKFTDELSGVTTTIAPTQGLVELEDPKDIEKYGPGPNGRTFWSPWLEGEYRNLATKGDDSKFRQEVLAEFIGSGDTVLSRLALSVVKSTVDNKWTTFKEPVPYINPNVGEHTFLDFQELLWIWKKPYTQADADKVISEANLSDLPAEAIPYPDRVPHVYVVGADPSSGEASDYCGIEVFDIITQEQVAELRIKALPKTFAKMVDYIGRWYNNALVVCERTGIGQAVCQELDRDLMYPNLYRHSKQTANLKTKYSQIGYPTSRTTKPMLVKHLVDNIGQDGYLIRSSRLYHEFCIFIHLGNNRYGNEPGTGNTDDIAMSTCLALAGIHDALMRDNKNLIPLHNMDIGPEKTVSVADSFGKLPGRVSKGLMIPYGVTSEIYTGKPSKTEELTKFTAQLGGLPLHKNTKTPHKKTDSVTAKKHILKYFRG